MSDESKRVLVPLRVTPELREGMKRQARSEGRTMNAGAERVLRSWVRRGVGLAAGEAAEAEAVAVPEEEPAAEVTEVAEAAAPEVVADPGPVAEPEPVVEDELAEVCGEDLFGDDDD